ncbi:MAG: valine--tRNA ligase, partial [Bacteroidia bacterium]|nr:valine--tRNA ligase [Bacteroidia bacterium]
EGLTAISDEEVIHKEVDSQLYYVRYQIAELDDEWITIATTRPETILGDTAVCVHPDDDRYKHLHGKHVIIPIVDRKVPIIVDDYITMEFGTGALKVTPAHDINDYKLGVKHNLEVVDVINDNGTMSEAAKFYVGEDRFIVRKKIAKDLKAKEYLLKTENLKNKVGYSERTNAVIEPKLSMQWFMKMKDISKPAYENVMNDNVALIPDKFKNTYRHWMENVQDWCISRQLWWGHRIPAWYLNDGTFVVANNADDALELARKQSGNPKLSANDIRQDEDVLDTWFSSWLWPISVFDGFKDPNNADINYYYPTNDLVTAPEILFFWVARMIIAGYEYRNEKPFNNVYLTGIVRDKQRRKMSKSLGNSPEPLELIKKYGADGVRVGMLFSSPAGNDLLFDEGLCEQGRNFSNKIWNSFRLISQLEIDKDLSQPESSKKAIAWFESKFNETLEQINDHFSKYRISDALMSVYKLIWDDYCSWYLEIVKPPFGEKIDSATHQASVDHLEKLLKILHPFMPFITEEIWHLSKPRDGEDCIVAQYPKVGKIDSDANKNFETAKELVSQLRNFRSAKSISPKESLSVTILENKEAGELRVYIGIIQKLANLDSIEISKAAPEVNTVSLMCKTIECHIHFEEEIDPHAEKERLTEELSYAKGFLNTVMKKLGNEKFVNNAKPDVVENERKKKSDTEEKIKSLEKQIEQLN